MKMTRLLFVLALTCSLGGRASAQSANDSTVEPSAAAPAAEPAHDAGGRRAPLRPGRRADRARADGVRGAAGRARP